MAKGTVLEQHQNKNLHPIRTLKAFNSNHKKKNANKSAFRSNKMTSPKHV